ncbi:MAG: PAS domain-containing protein, partial [Methanobacterium sp.]|nr:PAS domain-containing protein [Methanobacterium sp.]
QDGFIISANPAAEEILGLTLDQMQGRSSTDPLWRSVHEDMSDFPGEIHPSMIALKTGEKVKNTIMGIYNPEKESYTWININATPQFKKNESKPYQVHTTFEDITERKKAEYEQKSLSKQLQLALDAADMGWWYYDPIANISTYDMRYKEIFGVSGSQSPNEDILKLLHPDDLPDVWKKVEEALDPTNPKPYSAEYRIFKDDEIRWIDVYGRVFYTEENRPYRTLGVVSDITDIKNSEGRLKSLLTEKDAFLKEIHHRVKNNMQIIISLLNLLEGHVQSEETKTVLTDSQSRIMSMADIHENLYRSHDLSHINFKEYTIKLISDIFYTYGVQTDKIKFIIDMEDNEQNMETAIPLGLIINELVTNSLKHAFLEKEKGTIYLEMKQNEDNYELIVADDGIGMPQDIDINESLGLQIVNSLVNQLNGQITQDTSQGTKYTITFKELSYTKRF